MDKMPVNIDQRGAIGALLDQVGIPNLVVKCFAAHGFLFPKFCVLPEETIIAEIADSLALPLKAQGYH